MTKSEEGEFEHCLPNGVIIRHQIDSEGNHRLINWAGGMGYWASYTSLAVLPVPGTDNEMFVGATEYGLLNNTEECVARVEIIRKMK